MLSVFKKHARLILFILFAVLLLPFLIGAFGAHPATDDFTFATYTRPTWLETKSLPHVLKDALSYSLRTWRDWQGTVSGVIIMALNPAVFSLESYGLHAVVLLLLTLMSLYVFLRHMLLVRMRLPQRLFLPVYIAVACSTLLFLPDMVEGLYWFNGAWFYMGAHAVSLLTLTLCDTLCVHSGSLRRRVALSLLCCALLFFLGMDNYITAMMTAAALLMMALERLWTANRQAALRTALLLLPLAAGLLLSVVAPGNSVRMAADGAYEGGALWLLLSILRTLRDAALYFVRFFTKTPLLALLFCLTPALCSMAKTPARACPPIPCTLAGLYLILCAMIIPHMYTSGYAGSGRVVNMYHCYVLLASPIALALCLSRLSSSARQALSSPRSKRVFAVLAAVAMLVCLSAGQLSSYIRLVSEQLDGTQAAYTRQFRQEYALCEAAGLEDHVALPAWTVQTVTGKPTATADETFWTNASMADYFGVAGVYAAP